MKRSGGNSLKDIKNGICCKPANHPYNYGTCEEQQVSSSGSSGQIECKKEGYFIAGLHRGGGDALTDIDKFWCCTMSPGIAFYWSFLCFVVVIVVVVVVVVVDADAYADGYR